MNKKFTYLIIFILFLQGCGYSPIYSVQNKTNFKFNIVEINGSNRINDKFNIQIKRFSNNTSNNVIDLKIFTNKKKIIKNIQAEARHTRYEILVNYCKNLANLIVTDPLLVDAPLP